MVFLIYAGLLVYLTAHHEIWIDEMRALSLVRSSPSILDLFRNLRNEGHPSLWYLVLWAGSKLTASPLWLRLANGIFALGAAALLLWKSPLRLWERVLLLFGYFPLYEYGVIARNYAVGWFLFLLALTQYPDRFRRPLLFALTLLLLANANVGGWILVFSFSLAILWQWRSERSTPTDRGKFSGKHLLALFLVVLGLLFSALTSLPDEGAWATKSRDRSIEGLVQALWTTILSHGDSVAPILTQRFYLPAGLLFLALTVYLWRRKDLLLFLWVVILGHELLEHAVYGLSARHWGAVFLALLGVRWMSEEPGPQDRAEQRRDLSRSERVFVGLWILLLVLQVDLGISKARADVVRAYSLGQRAARFIKSEPRYENAIFLSETELVVEAMPYYLPNRIFMPRQGRFANYAFISDPTRRDMSLSEILEIAKHLRAEYNVPTILFYSHPSMEAGVYKAYENGSFTIDEASAAKAGDCIVPLRDWRKSPVYAAFAMYELTCE